MAFVPFATLSSQCSHLRKYKVCAWRGDQRIIGRWSVFRGETLHLPHSHRTRFPRIREGWRALPSAILGGGGFLGVGTSEVVVILLVGWLLLGPEKLFALAKDTGKILGELRSTANKAREQFDEAVELDLLAAEMKNKKSIEASKGSDNGMASMVDKLEDIGESEPLQTAELTKDLSSLGSSPDVAEALEEKSEEAGGDAFLDQLRRVSDPDQQAPIEIPDLEIDEEAEVKQLEEQYLYAKQRLERRKLEKQDRPEQNENKPVVRER